MKTEMIPTIQANFDEAKQSQLPFVEMLINLGYTYLPIEEVSKQRRGDDSKFILKDIAFQKLKEINVYEHKGQQYAFSDKDILTAIEDLENIQFNGLIDTSKDVFHMIMPDEGGKTIAVVHDGKKESKNFRYIDFKNPENNAFHVVVEFEAQGRDKIRPDIVVFVNGIPFAIIENKKSGVSIEEALSQQNRNQKADRCPKLFVYPQLLIGANREQFKYGTVGTPNKFYAHWKEKGVADSMMFNEARLNERAWTLIHTPIDKKIYQQLLQDLNGATAGHEQLMERMPTDQDRGVLALFEKNRLLDLCQNYILYDGGDKKISRYQQYFAINKMLERVKQDDAEHGSVRRRGGLVWHTQGSGKSLTMVMFVKALIEDQSIQNPRVIIVTDRIDLDKQIKETFQNCNLKKKVTRANTGEHLLQLIKDKNLDVITTLVQKFESADKKTRDFIDEDKNIFVLVDEAHRTQYGMANIAMNRLIPNACYIGFTGTPLMKKEKSKNKFGDYIDKYTISDALADGVILPLLYEGRYVDLTHDAEQIDRHVERLANAANAKQERMQRDITKGLIQQNSKRIEEIAFDVQSHYIAGFQGTGLKGQLVAPSKYAAIIFQKFFDRQGKVKTAVIISDENGIVSDEDTNKKEVIDYLKWIDDNYKSLKSYEDEVVNSFKKLDDGIEILIVVDKLLTGFDAPRNTVLYLAKDLKEHGLLQAIARVNRLFDKGAQPKDSGYIIDYSENAKNLDSAMRLFGDFDENDVEGALIDINQKIQDLEDSHAAIHDLFKDVSGSKDDEPYMQRLAEEKDRREYYELLNNFIKNFNECLSLREFPNRFEHIDVYKKELKKFVEIRRSATLRFADNVDLTEYKVQLARILDQYIDAKGVELLTDQISITDSKKFEEALEDWGSDRSKAEAIAAQTDRVIREQFEKDPNFYQRFSDKVSDVLQQMREGKLADVEALSQMKLLKDEILDKEDDAFPEAMRMNPGLGTLYRNIQHNFEEFELEPDQLQKIIINLFHVMKDEMIIDWHKNNEVKRIMRDKMDDFLYEYVKIEQGVPLRVGDMQKIIEDAMRLAENNYEQF